MRNATQCRRSGIHRSAYKTYNEKNKNRIGEEKEKIEDGRSARSIEGGKSSVLEENENWKSHVATPSYIPGLEMLDTLLRREVSLVQGYVYLQHLQVYKGNDQS